MEHSSTNKYAEDYPRIGAELHQQVWRGGNPINIREYMQLTFSTEEGSARSININDPAPDVSAGLVSGAGSRIIAAQPFAGITLEGLTRVRVITTTRSEIELAS